MSEINYMDPKEFREKGYLQELNRLFLHPLGLALEIVIEADGTEKIGNVWDYRQDAEGIYYDLANSGIERVKGFHARKNFIDRERIRRSSKRYQLLGFDVEPIEVPEENHDRV